jgi:hypothetical protein
MRLLLIELLAAVFKAEEVVTEEVGDEGGEVAWMSVCCMR